MATYANAFIIKSGAIGSPPYTVPAGHYVVSTYYVSSVSTSTLPIGTIATIYYGPTQVLTQTFTLGGATWTVMSSYVEFANAT